MDHIVFENKGLIDLRALQTFGVSVKEGHNPIGYFGTGAKYALAVMLREGCEVVLYRGTERYEFRADVHNVRGRDFSLVMMNGEPMAFTTELGKNWKLWQAYRELHCNAVDEQGTIYAAADDPGPAEDMTRWVVRDDEFSAVFADRFKHVLGSKPIYASVDCEVHPGRSESLFYRGIRVADLRKPSVFTYNILRKMDLTEDRTLAYQFFADWAVRDMLLGCDDAEVVREALSGGDGSYENAIDFTEHMRVQPSEQFLEVAGTFNRDYGRDTNRSAVHLYRRVQRAMATRETEKHMTLNEVQAAQLKRAISFLGLIDCDVSQYPLVVLDDLGENIMGLSENKTMYLSRKAFDMGTKQVASTLFEEYVHTHYGHGDCTREMQTFLFDRLLTLAEQAILKEPL